MRQVPTYLLIGRGRVAKHFQHYFSLLNLQYHAWHRDQSLAQLQEFCQAATHILLLISDSAIVPFIQEHLSQSKATLIHCSGVLNCPEAYSAHPLMTFSQTLYPDELYQNIPFIIDQHAPDFKDLLPGLNNPHARLNPDLKAKYHALCVLSGNFTCLLWQKAFQSFEQELKLPKEMLHMYLKQQMQNLLQDPDNALTGPLKRKDQATIAKNIQALDQDPYQQIYTAFVKCYEEQT